MSILVIGSQGMIGKEVCNRLKGLRMTYRGISRQDLDITDVVGLSNLLASEKPDIVINCAGIVKGRDLEDEEYLKVNTYAPNDMALMCDNMGIRMVQISTDCVFSGDKPCDENNFPDAVDIYGYSKAQGEIFHNNHLTIRCSFIGFGERGLITWLRSQEGKVPGFGNVQWNGMTSMYAAVHIIDLAFSTRKGVIHIFGEDTTKYDVLCTINKVLGLGFDIKKVDEPVEDHRLRTITNYRTYLPLLEHQLKEMVDAYRSDTSRA